MWIAHCRAPIVQQMRFNTEKRGIINQLLTLTRLSFLSWKEFKKHLFLIHAPNLKEEMKSHGRDIKQTFV